MAEETRGETETKPAETLIGGRTRSEVNELLARRGLSQKTRDHYLTYLRRASRFCEAHGTTLDELENDLLTAFVATLPPSRSTIMSIRVALEHYWAAIGRRHHPSVDLVGVLGTNGAEPSSIRAARERVNRFTADLAEPASASWAAVGYHPLWLREKLLARGLGPKTVSAYLNAIRRVHVWCGEHGTTLDAMTPSELEEFAVEVPWTRWSRMQMRVALDHYWSIAGRMDPPTFMMRVPKKPRMLSKALDTDVAQALEMAALARRDLPGLAVIIGLYLGLRRFEIAQLRWVDFEDGWLTVIGKGDVTARLPVQPLVSQYLSWVPRTSAFVFPGRAGGSVCPASVWIWVRKVAEDAGLGRISTHVLRHTALTIANDATGDLRAVQDFARHADPDTTSGYTKVTKQRLEKVANAIAASYRPEASEPYDLADPSELDGPYLGFGALIGALEGSHAVAPWRELAGELRGHGGWQLRATDDGSGTLWFAFGDRFSASVLAWTNERAPSFVLSEITGPTEEDVTSWDFSSAAELSDEALWVERGERPHREPTYVTTWVDWPSAEAATAD